MADAAEKGALKDAPRLPLSPPPFPGLKGEAAAAGGGFSAHLRGASLSDLVQMECLARLRSVVRIESGGRTGTLYFEGGRIVHAETARARGEAAALEVLSWDGGSLETVVEPIPSARSFAATISCSPEALLLRAAQARDERGRPNLVALPGRSANGRTAEGGEGSDRRGMSLFDEDNREKDVNGSMGSDATGGNARDGNARNNDGFPSRGRNPEERATHEREAIDTEREDLPVAVRLAPSGAVLESTDDELADAVAYAVRLAGLIGELMGLDGLRAMELASKSERLLAYVELDGELTAVRVPTHVNVAKLRERAGL